MSTGVLLSYKPSTVLSDSKLIDLRNLLEEFVLTNKQRPKIITSRSPIGIDEVYSHLYHNCVTRVITLNNIIGLR